MTLATEVSVRLGSNSYDISVGEGVIELAGQKVADILGRRKIFVVTDENVSHLYEKQLRKFLEEAGHEVVTIIVAAGETSKDFGSLEHVVEEMLRQHVTRGSALIAFGGGVVGDLAGFAASIVMRGIDYVQVPTTLLSQVDSSVGGKTAINVPAGKNLVGAFHQPRLVLCDLDTLRTVPKREYRAGLAEVIKYGIIHDAKLFNRLEGNLSKLLKKESATLASVIARCCVIKAEIVGQDEKESGLRAILNFGHTIGHALEAISRYGKYLHGEAISIGQVAAANISQINGNLSEKETARIVALFERAGLPTSVKLSTTQTQRLLDVMKLDKKVNDGKIQFVLAQRIGNVKAGQSVSVALIKKSLIPPLTLKPSGR